MFDLGLCLCLNSMYIHLKSRKVLGLYEVIMVVKVNP